MLLVIHHERPMLISMGLMAWYQHLFSLGRKPFDLKAAHTAAGSGDPEAQFALGLNYCGESGVAPDFERAVQWLRKAADQDHAQAQVHLAAMLAGGQGTPQDAAAALNWTRRAAEGGEAVAQHDLGSRYYRSSLDPFQMDATESRTEAYKWFHLAEAQGFKGSAAACESITLRMSLTEVTDGNRRVSDFVARKRSSPSAMTITR